MQPEYSTQLKAFLLLASAPDRTTQQAFQALHLTHAGSSGSFREEERAIEAEMCTILESHGVAISLEKDESLVDFFIKNQNPFNRIVTITKQQLSEIATNLKGGR
jgi:hypothetical protein